jgi:hypothetical protein
MIALCSFPFLLGSGLIRTLGLDPDDPGFPEEMVSGTLSSWCSGASWNAVKGRSQTP